MSAPRPILRAGLTGGTASGQSTVARMFAALGAYVVEADAIVHELLRAGHPVHAAVVERFGPGILDAAGHVDRRRLGSLVFSDADARGALEAIVHPAVLAEAQRRFADFSRRGEGFLAMLEAALLVETGRYRDFDRLIVTRCSPETQLRRLRERGLSDAEARARLAAQAPLEAKLAVADYVVDTDASLELTARQVAAVYQALRRDWEGRRAGVSATRPGRSTSGPGEPQGC